MRLPQAATELLTTPTQTITEYDAYKVDGVKTITDVKDVLLSAGKDAVTAARNSPRLVAEMAQVLVKVKSGSMSQAEALGRVASVVGGNSGILNKLSNTVKSAIVTGLGVDGKKVDAVLSTIGGVTRVSQYGDITRTSDMMDLFGVITGNEELMKMTDLSAEAAVLGGILREVISLGIPDAINILMDQASSDEQRYIIARDNLSLGINSGDVSTVMALVNRLGGATVRARYPNFIKDFLSRYRKTLGVSDDKFPGLKAEMIAMFLKVDPLWDLALYGETLIPSLLPFSNISDDAKSVFLSTPDHQVQVLLAAQAREINLINWIKQNYPYFPG